MKLNVAKKVSTHEGARAGKLNAELMLRRSVMSCMLWEDQFYENGVSISERIKDLIPKVKAEVVANIAIEARTKANLRHVPLLIVREMARLDSHKHLVADTLNSIILRPDEMTEFLAIYWAEKRQPLSAQVKKGLAMAFTKFNAYQLAKYDQDGKVKLRDVLFLCHAKPLTVQQGYEWNQLIKGELPIPDTWETNLSAGADKKGVWERLIHENKLGGLALLRNLRNMQEVGVDKTLMEKAITTMNTDRILPFRFISAARYAPHLEPVLETAMFKSLNKHEKLVGKTVLLVDVSGSMDNKVSTKSEISRLDAACGLAMLLREIGNCEVYTFSNELKTIPARQGFALRDAIVNSQKHSGTYLGRAINNAPKDYNRLIVITDEQSHDDISAPSGAGYVINVASYRNGIGYGPWLHIDGWSESVVSYIQQMESVNV